MADETMDAVNSQLEGSVGSWNAKYSPWEFVHCGICYLPFINPKNPDAPPVVPFWLTECSHVVCNNHLSPDQSCRQCGTNERVELMPLQRQLPDPMRQWFANIPQALEDIVGATKFQHEMLVDLVQFYKSKYGKERSLVERLRKEVENLKAENARIKGEVSTMRDGGYASLSEGGKRRRVEGAGSSNHSSEQLYPSQRLSSPGLGPSARSSRLTLRPGSSRVEQEQQAERSSPMNLEEFAYRPPQRMQEEQLVSTARATNIGNEVHVGTARLSTSKPVPLQRQQTVSQTPLPGRFKPTPQLFNQNSVTVRSNPAQAQALNGTRRFQPGASMIDRVQPSNPTYASTSRLNEQSKFAVPSTPSSTRRFVLPTPIHQPIQAQQMRQVEQRQMQGRNGFVSGESQGGERYVMRFGNRPDSRMQMPPPPSPGGSRFRANGMG